MKVIKKVKVKKENESEKESESESENDPQLSRKNIDVKLGTRVTLNERNNIEVDKKSDAGSVQLNEYDLRLSENYFPNENENKIKLKYLFPTLNYKKLKMERIMSIIDEQFEKGHCNYIIKSFGYYCSYLSCQKNSIYGSQPLYVDLVKFINDTYHYYYIIVFRVEWN